MSRNLRLGASSIAFSKPLYIESAASIVSQKEADGPLGDFFDLVCEDPMFGCDTWESAESTLQKETATLAMNKAGLNSEDIHLMFAGDLLAQTAATCFGSAGLGIPFYGLYGACSTMGESLSLGCLALTAGFGTRVLCATSSHFASAEKEFRFPLGYGNQRPFSATWTVTGSGACGHKKNPLPFPGYNFWKDIGGKDYGRTATAASSCVSILRWIVIDQDSAVFMNG